MLEVFEENHTPYSHNKSEHKLIFPRADGQGKPNEVLFEGMDDRERIKSIQGITSIWVEEATELVRDDYLQLDLRLRDPSPDYRQIMFSFNPDESRGGWLKEEFFYDDIPKAGPGKKVGSYIHHSTYLDNPNEEIIQEYQLTLSNLNDATYDKIYRLGLWATYRGLIYPDWDAVPLPQGIGFDDILYGLDFGFSVNPAAFVKIYRKADEYWCQQLIYEKRLTGQDLADKIKALGKDIIDLDSAIIYADSENPMAIEEMCRTGLVVKPCIKGQGSVKAGIDLLKSKKIHLLQDSPDLIEERKIYKYKEDKDGNPLPEPVKLRDHGMDAIRYAIYTDAKEGMHNMELIVLG